MTRVGWEVHADILRFMHLALPPARPRASCVWLCVRLSLSLHAFGPVNGSAWRFMRLALPLARPRSLCVWLCLRHGFVLHASFSVLVSQISDLGYRMDNLGTHCQVPSAILGLRGPCARSRFALQSSYAKSRFGFGRQGPYTRFMFGVSGLRDLYTRI